MKSESTILLFDGCCHLCNGIVQFILRRKHKDRFRFIPLQSEKGKELLRRYDVAPETDSIVLIENGRFYTRSEAIFRIFKRLGGGWKVWRIFRLLPRKWNDILYDYVARNRFKWFGRKESCVMEEIE